MEPGQGQLVLLKNEKVEKFKKEKIKEIATRPWPKNFGFTD